MAKPTKPGWGQAPSGESGSEISLTSDIATITVSCPHLAAAGGSEHLLVVMDTTELTDNL